MDLDADCGERVSAFARHDGDQATAARTIGELKAEIATLGRLQSLAHIVRGSGADRKWKELASLLGEIFNAPLIATTVSAKILPWRQHHSSGKAIATSEARCFH